MTNRKATVVFDDQDCYVGVYWPVIEGQDLCRVFSRSGITDLVPSDCIHEWFNKLKGNYPEWEAYLKNFAV